MVWNDTGNANDGLPLGDGVVECMLTSVYAKADGFNVRPIICTTNGKVTKKGPAVHLEDLHNKSTIFRWPLSHLLAIQKNARAPADEGDAERDGDAD